MTDIALQREVIYLRAYAQSQAAIHEWVKERLADPRLNAKLKRSLRQKLREYVVPKRANAMVAEIEKELALL